jgi:hypothetical protein
VTDATTLVPPATTAKAEKRKRLAGAFGPRFFLLMAIGLVWLGGAFHDPRFFYAMAAWDVLVLVAWGIDLASLPSPKSLSITPAGLRSWRRSLTMFRQNCGRRRQSLPLSAAVEAKR